MKIICPVCENYLMKGFVLKSNEEVFVCDECERLLPVKSASAIAQNCLDMQTYLESQGLDPTWDSIKVIEEIADI